MTTYDAFAQLREAFRELGRQVREALLRPVINALDELLK